MTSFVNIHPSTQHLGAARVESALSTARVSPLRMSATRGLTTLLLSAMTTAAMVLAYQIMDTVAEGHLMVIWMAMWFVAFAALALFAGSARRMAVGTKKGLDAWSRGLAEARADKRLWAMAKADPRIMSDLQMVISRNEIAAEVKPAEVDATQAQAKRAERARRAKIPLLRGYQHYAA